jgi:truncated hemoglobin YjbI
VLRMSGWAKTFLKPIHNASTRVKVLSKKLQASKKQKRQDAKQIETLEAELVAARLAKKQACDTVGGKLKSNPDHELAKLINSAPNLQGKDVRDKHLADATSTLAKSVRQDLQRLQTHMQKSKIDAEEAQSRLEAAEKALQAFDPDLYGEDMHDSLLSSVEDAADQVEMAEDTHKGLLDAWEFEVDKANGLDGLVVRVGKEGKVSVYTPDIAFDACAQDFLQGLVADACEGLYRGVMVDKLIPANRWYLEALHLLINTGNSWVEVARNTFQYLLTPEGRKRDRGAEGNRAHEWGKASSNSWQTKEWQAAGFNFEEHITKVLGRKMSKPVTKYHGSQIEAIFRGQDELWGAEPLRSGIEELEGDREVGGLVKDLKRVFEALAIVHREVTVATPNMEALETAVRAFMLNHSTFTDDVCLAPIRYRLKFYDHAIIAHVLEQQRTLLDQGMSLGMVSSKFLEANNKVVKGVMRRLPGGGSQASTSASRMPLVQALKKCIAMGKMGRHRVYKDMLESCKK